MGCGASVVPPATDEEKVEMMTFALKEMMLDVGTHAITNGAQVQVPAPLDQCGKIRESVQKIKDAAAAAKEKLSGGGGGAAAAADKAAAAGGALGGMFGGGMAKMAAAVDSGMDAAGSAAGAGIETALNAAADTIQKGIDKLDDDFAKVGQEVAGAKVDDIIAVYKSIINDRKVDTPQVFVRGVAPHSPSEAAACAKDAVSGYIADNARQELVDKMLPVCMEAVQGSSACKSWKALIDAYNAANEKIGSLGEAGQKFKQEPITLEIERYIVEQVVLGYRTLMATKETANRANPKSVTVPKNPTTFERCWDVSSTGIAYGDFKKNHFQDYKFNNL